MRTTTIAMATALLAAANVLAAATPTTSTALGVASPSTFPQLGSPKSQGCFSSVGSLTKLDPPLQYMAMGSCTGACIAISAKVSALHASDCYCGDTYPPHSAYTDVNSHCNYPCPYYNIEACGGIVGDNNTVDYFSIFNNGLQVDVPSDASPSSTNSASPSSSTTSQSTVVVTQTSKPSGGANAGGIAAGVIVGVLAIAGIVGGVFYFLRRKRNREIEEEYRRNAAVNAFINGSKPPPSSGGLSLSDQRLDPVMAQRRLSDGSIADNEDYSRRILRVTNA